MDRAQESSKQLRINNTISSCIKQALTGRLFFIAVAGIVFALGIGGFADFWKAAGDYKEGLIAYGTHLKVLQNAIKSDALCLLLPVFAALPYTSAFLEEIDSGFIKSYLPRAREVALHQCENTCGSYKRRSGMYTGNRSVLQSAAPYNAADGEAGDG